MAGPASARELSSARELLRPDQGFGIGDLRRVAIWGIVAAGALMVAAVASTTAVGINRLMQAAGQLQEAARPTAGKPPRPFDAREGQRLAESVLLLANDRERLAERINAVEHSLESITGSIARISKAAEAAAERPAPAFPAMSAEGPPAEEATASVNTAAAAPAASRPPLPQPAPAPEPAGKSEFGLDLGTGGSIEVLRALWAKARQQHATALDGLRPIVHLRENRRTGTIELRLVAGPLPTAIAAARLCTKFTATGAACQPAPYDGQRLAAR